MFDYIVVYITLGSVVLNSVLLIFYLNKQNALVRTTVVQYFAIATIIPFIVTLATLNRIGENTIATILGAVVGYIFGKTGLTQEWTETKQG